MRFGVMQRGKEHHPAIDVHKELGAVLVGAVATEETNEEHPIKLSDKMYLVDWAETKRRPTDPGPSTELDTAFTATPEGPRDTPFTLEPNKGKRSKKLS